MKLNHTLKKGIIFFLICLPPIAFFALFFRYTVDVPVNDDYRAILDNLNKTLATDSVSEKITLFFSQHNEHRIAYDRFWTLLCYKLNGQVNFNYLSLTGNLSLFGIFFIFYKRVREISTNVLFVLPLSILVFNITFYENMTFAMATMSNITVYLFSLLSLYFLTKEPFNGKHLSLAILFLFLSTYTQGGGLFMVPIGVAILVFRKLWKQLFIFSMATLLLLCFYFIGYESPSYHPSVISTLIDFKVRALLFSLAFLGNAFNYNLIYTNDLNESVGLATVIGFIFLVAYLYLIKIKYYKKNLFVFSVLSLVVLTSFVTGVTRCQFGLETSGASRYRIASVIFLIGLYLAFIQNYSFSHKKSKYILIIASLGYFFFIGLRQYEYLSIREKEVMTGVLKYHSGEFKKLSGFEQDFYDIVIRESYKMQTYYLPSFQSLEMYFPYSKELSLQPDKYDTGQTNFNIQAIDKVKDSYLIDGWAYIENESASNQEVYIGLKSPSQTNIKFMTIKQIPKFDLNPYFKKFNLQEAGFLARIRLSDLQNGENEIYILIKNGDKLKLIKTDKKLIV